MITARGGEEVRSPGLAFDELPTSKYTVPSGATATSFSRWTSSPAGSRSGRSAAMTVRVLLIPAAPQG